MEITPSSSTPRTTKVRAAKPAVPKSSAPVKKKPAETKPAAAKPAIAKPMVAKPEVVKPKVDKPVAAKPKVAAAPRQRKAVAVSKPEVSVVADLSPMIATAAYYLAERRHFVPGHEMQDWLAAEHFIHSMTGK